MKTCFKCKQEKPLDSFYRHPRMADGHLNKCKQCTKKDVFVHREMNLERVRAYDRSRSNLPHRVEARAAYQKTEAYAQSHRAANDRWVSKYPERRYASHLVRSAIFSGKINRFPCMVCGDKRVEGHHPDYSRPLDVVWLCVKHHKQVHKETV